MKPSLKDDEQPYAEEAEDDDDENNAIMKEEAKYKPDRRGRIRRDWCDEEVEWLTAWILRQKSGSHLIWTKCVAEIRSDVNTQELFEGNCHLCKDKLRDKYRRMRAEGLVD